MNFELKNTYALVCGSTQGIGKQTAITLANEGVNVTLLARNENSLKETLKKLPEGNHNYIVADFSKPEEVELKVNEFITNNHGFHILINNTGGPPSGQIIEATAEQFYRAFNMHLICSHLLAQACLPFMKSEGFGRIINVISTSVKEPIPGLGVSNTIRNAVGNWSKTMSFELARFGITVNNVLPGFTATSRLDEIVGIKAKKESKTIESMEEEMKQYVPAKRFGKPEETAAAIAFLASRKAGYINGINLPVDGGRTKSL
ncbi:SDR family oxidoreductase [Aegicerativicinus sediminis]|uniref:SDR family oxidoreductase n=1 Tax=Aegicerativicinus sediminis TaxID=2893202 RepID=UPI001E607B3F|nr:SDR family oxidoreductase [Aegicerativicinus sediminis]